MKEKIKIIMLVAAVALNFLVLFSPVAAPTAHAAGILPCGGQEKAAADKLLNDPSQANVAAYKASSCQFADIFTLIARITNMLVGFAGIYAILLIVIAGFRMVYSAGNAEMLSAGKAGLSNAVIGFILVMVAYVVVNTIFEIFNVKLTGQSSGFMYNPFLGK